MGVVSSHFHLDKRFRTVCPSSDLVFVWGELCLLPLLDLLLLLFRTSLPVFTWGRSGSFHSPFALMMFSAFLIFTASVIWRSIASFPCTPVTFILNVGTWLACSSCACLHSTEVLSLFPRLLACFLPLLHVWIWLFHLCMWRCTPHIQFHMWNLCFCMGLCRLWYIPGILCPRISPF